MDRVSREKCWKGRDAFFACLDRNGVVDPLSQKNVDTVGKECGREKGEFEEGCVATWVDYFCKKRVMEIQRAQLIEDAQKRGVQVLGPQDVRHPGGKGDSA